MGFNKFKVQGVLDLGGVSELSLGFDPRSHLKFRVDVD